MGIINRVIVICTGNICRSPMGAAVLQEALRQAQAPVIVTSAGLGAMGGQKADPIAIKLMAERGLDINDHNGAQFTSSDGFENDLILVMETEQRYLIENGWPLLQGRVYRFGHWGNFEIDDPYQRGEEAFRKALKMIDAGVVRWLEQITA
ncbi:MAG: protein-tyrosine phosphatase [Gammaproteobacteria bacterium]|jgi:protein-tyrosine phosphatase